MANRRRSNDYGVWAITQLIALVVCLGVFVFPQARQLFQGLAILVPVVIVLALICTMGLALLKLITKEMSSVGGYSLNVSTASDTTLPPCPSQFQTTAQIVSQLRSIDWFQFEQLVSLLYRKLGYTVTRRGGANPDGGIDLIIEKNGHREAIQCKHWKTWKLGVKAVREFLGALTDTGISRGIFITLGGYTADAKQLADKHGIIIVNETELAKLLEATDARFDPAVTSLLHDKRKLCPKCEKPMVLRTARKGAGAGTQFWGCTRYPACHYTMPA